MNQTDLASRANVRLGTILKGKYRLDRVLGIGGMATVYAATHRNGKEFAIKVLHAELSLHTDIRTRFVREGYAANALKHPGAVAVLDDDSTDDGLAFLVMELLEGETVEQLWERSGRALPTDRVLSIGTQVLDVLAAAHAHSIVHRDVKPANLFVCSDGRLKVLDFGIARLRDAAMTSSGATQTGLTIGTPSFMAPEQAMARSSEIDGQTDVWAVGATLFTLASGRLVHAAENAQQALVVAATTRAPSLGAVAPHLPAAFVGVVDRALAFDKLARWPTAVAMRDALLGLSGQPAVVTQAVPFGQPPTPAPSGASAVTPALSSLTTGRPVSSHGARSTAGRRSAVPIFALAAFVGAAMIAGVVLVTVHGRGTGAPPVAPAVSLVASPLQSAPSPAASEPPATTVLAPAATSEVASAARAPASARPSAHAPAPPPVAPAKAAPLTKPDCNPNYFFDPDGNKHFKPECF